jgi:hypothetical protein
MFKNFKDIDPIDKMLLFGIVFFTGVLIYIARWAPQDGQTFQVVSGLLTGFSGAFFARLKPKPDSTTPTGLNTGGDVPSGTNK